MQKDFITVTPDSGNGNGTVTVAASENTGNSRTSSITISGGGITKTIEINQSKFDGYLPNEAPKGVYIMNINKRLFPKESWDTSKNADVSGIAVKTDRGLYCIAKKEFYRTVKWGDKVLVPNCFTSTDEVEAKGDYNGEKNTQAIIAQFGSQNFAAKVCQDYKFPHGSNGYLPSLGEWCDVLQNGDVKKIDECLILIGGNTMFDYDVSDNYKWSSSQYDKNNAWCVDIIERDKGRINPLDREKTLQYPNSNILGTRPFCKIE